MPQFVLLHHECPGDVPRPTHWDFMLQEHDALRTWVLSELPSAWASAIAADASTGEERALRDVVLAEETQRHRLEYLTKVGTISGGRGHVAQIDRGNYELLEWSDVRICVRLSGERIRGGAQLTRLGAVTPHWRLSLWTGCRSSE